MMMPRISLMMAPLFGPTGGRDNPQNGQHGLSDHAALGASMLEVARKVKDH